jgi:microcystin-dependent protein
MPAINFPNNPVNNQIFKDLNNNITYIYVVDPESPGNIGKWRAAYLGEESDIDAAIADALGTTSIDIDAAINDSQAALLAAENAEITAGNALSVANGIAATANAALQAANDAINAANIAISAANDAVATANASRTPAGIVVWVTGSNAPSNQFVKAVGQTLSRSAFPRLWSWAQTSGLLAASEAEKRPGGYGPGNGTTTFSIPDMRSVFIRGLDDGKGVDSLRVLGTLQASQNIAHNHGVTDPQHSHGTIDPGHGHGISDPGHAHTLGTPTPVFGGVFSGGFNPSAFNIYAASTPTTTASVTGIGIFANGTNLGIRNAATGISILNSGGTESRPQNIALLPCITV